MSDSSPPLSPVLITGGCGFIGSHLVERLLVAEPNCRIHVLDINTDRNRIPSVNYHTCDITSAKDVLRVMQEAQPRVVFHTACPDSMVILPELFEKVNVGGAKNLLSSADKVETLQALVYTSTSSVIHDNLTDLFDADETFPVLRPPAQKGAYTLTKADAEELILGANRKSGDKSMLTVSIRPATAFGERDTICLGKLFAVAQAGKMKFQMGNGKNLHDFVYVGNLADGHILAAQALVKGYGKPPPITDRVDGECFNITNDETVLFWEFARKVAAAAGHPVKKEDIIAIPVFLGLFFGWISELVVWILSRGGRQPNMTKGFGLALYRRLSKGKRLSGCLVIAPVLVSTRESKRG